MVPVEASGAVVDMLVAVVAQDKLAAVVSRGEVPLRSGATYAINGGCRRGGCRWFSLFNAAAVDFAGPVTATHRLAPERSLWASVHIDAAMIADDKLLTVSRMYEMARLADTVHRYRCRGRHCRCSCRSSR